MSEGRWGREDERNGRRGKERYEQKIVEKEQECLKKYFRKIFM